MWEWLGPVLTGIGGFLGGVVPLYLKFRQEMRKLSKDRDKQQKDSERKERRDAINEWKEVVEEYRQNQISDRALIQDLREDLQQAYTKIGVLEKQFEEASRDRADLKRRLEAGSITPHGPESKSE